MSKGNIKVGEHRIQSRSCVNPDNDKRKSTTVLLAKMNLFLLFYFPQFLNDFFLKRVKMLIIQLTESSLIQFYTAVIITKGSKQ